MADKLIGPWFKKSGFIPSLYKNLDITITSSAIPQFGVSGGSLTIDNNGDGTWHLYSDDAITKIQVNGNYDNMTEVVVHRFDTVTDFSTFLPWCSNLTSVDMSGVTSNAVTSMSQMFDGCTSLTSIDLSHLTWSGVTSTTNVFYLCSSLTSLKMPDLSGSVITSSYNIFEGCSSLTHLDLSNFSLSSGVNIRYLFKNCTDLVCITNLDTTSGDYKDDLFLGCSSLVQPDATAQADLQDSNGAVWVNANACP